eukprot:Gregarina_sp_Poly_1__11071@NODE_88_length_15218_cov_183_340440_g76_i0_p5_GENE_NODE_88_length_15218_cov_183_340440_g76_i0NODE_88_length_15218_cov_183_340440_g76_i0_p5_ORF_typecomplete_len365_score29_41zfUBP/PF02148_19/1_4e18zfUBP_var/PF17807_1/0_18DUF4062/PF13271_6/4_7DUF4062/PF13271_6/2_7e02_NODE_88_length_15218_cov_183_340440_g76_i074098503
MFRVDIFSSQLAPNVKPGVIHVIKYADMQLRRLDTQKVTLKSLVVAIPSSISVDLTCSALRASSAIVLEVEGLDMHGYYSLLIEHASFEEQQHILKTYYGCQITNESVFYILPIAELDFHEINFRAKFEGETLPCCPACLERIDFIDFPHNIWFKPSGWCSTVPLSNCKVCMTVHQSLGSQRIFSCLDCQETSDLQICMICGAIGCSRYQAAHAKRHSDETGHTLCMDIDSGRIWDYPNDQYRHRRLKTGEISLDWKFAKADVKDERMGLLTTEFPEEFSTLNALKCALRHSVENEETEEAKQLEALINEWMNWLDHFVTELMKRKSNFEYSLEAIEHDATSKAAQLEKEILRLQESKVRSCRP